MNRIAYTRAISLVGKLAAKGFIEGAILTAEEKELVRQCLEEYNFYHSHEEKPLVAAGSVSKPSRQATGK